MVFNAIMNKNCIVLREKKNEWKNDVACIAEWGTKTNHRYAKSGIKSTIRVQ